MSAGITRLEDYDIRERFEATVVSSERITAEASDEEVRELVIDVGRPEFAFRIGQSVGIFAPGAKEMGQKERFRLYSVADLSERGASGNPRIKICVKRCSYVDEYSGEQYKGLTSHYLCDRRPGDALELAGPFGLAFEVPEDLDANLVLIGSGTGIAPFRAFVKHIYRNVPGWEGRICLFYGAKSGLEMLYMNDQKNDFAQYYDEETFEAVQALSSRPGWTDRIDWGKSIAERGEELWTLLSDAKTYVYIAGLEKMRDELDAVFAQIAGSKEKWARRKAELAAGGRWVELLY